ncbi:MAG: hypothetical protein K2H74_01295, partial [Paramuribaculum sp.]|nr:hypothetical protein [Paramuribaculum sp.]
RIECGNLLARAIPIIVIITLLSAVMVTIDIRYSLIGLIVLFLIIPFAVFHIYFSKLLNTKSVYALAPKSVTIQPDMSISITYYRTIAPDKEPEITKVTVIRPSEIKKIYRSGSNIAITPHKADDYILIIPTDALSVEELDTILDFNPVGNMEKID